MCWCPGGGYVGVEFMATGEKLESEYVDSCVIRKSSAAVSRLNRTVRTASLYRTYVRNVKTVNCAPMYGRDVALM
jgi:hypothetical protein